MEKVSLMKHLFNRQVGQGSAKYEASRTDMMRSINHLRPVHQMNHHVHASVRKQQDQLSTSSTPTPRNKNSSDYKQIARLRFNKPGNLVGTSYWSHGAMKLWSWQHELQSQELPSSLIMDCSIVRFDWLYSNPEEHILAIGRHGDVKLVDLRQLVCYELMAQQQYTNMAYSLHPEIPCDILYGMRHGVVRNFDIRRGPLPKDIILTAKSIKDATSTYHIYSLKINPANCNQFAVAGCTEDVRLYDRRYIKRILHTMYMTTYPGLRTNSNGLQDITGEYSYITNERRLRRGNLQEMSFNYNGTQLALSCGYDSIYLFDTSSKYPMGSFGSNCLQMRNNPSTVSSITGSVVYGIEFFGQRSDFMIAMARGHEHSYDITSGEIPPSRKRTSLYVWDSFTQKLIRRIPMEDRNWNFATHPYLPVIATALDETGIQLWNAT